ncbi:type III secretion system export apparatus subunit SctV [Thiothrix fructosivorans]|jgi:type III secretion protein V|uniref:Type III secretion system export apparatus subunit SctV n=1 Tax=Thiothrix fructosivorans TaxID=111770 RepID=A0A8B0SET1_9GAMM|nr:type III secretion system export apparatus subunit SctV [Thiothrix fructosivorans]MBO0614417.1 type III secretion system export apparatus subunit SctV [Thiothrix fructosivorans]QTX09259.1 type III secretion system export apparatus subunit SctV [Thiothrix fructosivorans]
MQSSQSQNLLQSLTRRSDVALALLLVAIIAMMILPMPTLVMDMLIALNMSIAILLMMLGIYISHPLAISSFPSILLLTTLFRLSLGIATTRLILLEGDAGHIVQTFGEFVVGGNLVVGLVVFLIITIVQFIVITKGSERIAEVSARFSLDAMPGKQMSIDSDMRAGLITLADARHRRSNLEKESQLYGALDGAMKFVKGDAIAGLIIIMVNIIGGMAIGTMQRGMTMGDAVQLYSILTIGDGLVSQIPALFISITAGIIVTRVRGEEEANLGSDIGGQMLAQPSALLGAAAIVTGMGLIPGFPTMVFLFLGVMLGITGMALRKVQNQMEFSDAEITTVIGQHDAAQLGSGGGDIKAALEDMQPLSPALVELPMQAKTLFSLDALNLDFMRIRKEFYQDMGVPLPGISLKLSAQLSNDNYQVSIRGVPVAQGHLQAASPISVGAEALKLPVDKAGNEMVTGGTRPATDNIQAISLHLAYILRKHAAEFIGIQEIHTLYSKLEQSSYAELVREVQRAVTTPKTVDVFRRLLNEGVSIRDLRQILGTLVEFGESEKDTSMLAERVRISLKRQLSYTATNGTGILPVYMFAPETEKLLQNSLRQTPNGVFFALAPDATERFANTLRELENEHSKNKVRPVILTNLELRRHIRRHLENSYPDLPVISVQELTSSVSLSPIGEIRLT